MKINSQATWRIWIQGENNENPELDNIRTQISIEPLLKDEQLTLLFRGTVEATEEAILNSVFMSDTVVGQDDNISLRFLLEQIEELRNLLFLEKL